MQFRLGRHVLQSNKDLDLEPVSGRVADVTLHVHDEAAAADDTLGLGMTAGWYHAFERDDGSVWLEASATSDGYLLRYRDLVDFHLTDEGRRVDAYPRSSTPLRSVRHLFLAQVWPVLLSLRGHIALHASAVRIGDIAVAFVGHTGLGKSTLAASFNRRGHALLTDDVLLLEPTESAVRAVPSYPEQRLWSDSAEALATAPESLGEVAHYTSKKNLRLPLDESAFEERTLPLGAIFALDEPGGGSDDEVTVVPLTLSEAYVALLDQVFRLDFSDRTRMALEVEQLTSLVHAVPVLRLAYPRRYSMLDRVHRAVADAVAVLPSPDDSSTRSD